MIKSESFLVQNPGNVVRLASGVKSVGGKDWILLGIICIRPIEDWVENINHHAKPN